MSSRATHVHPTHRTTTASGMRRNLFNSTLSRRPTAPSTTSATSATTLHLADVDDEEGEEGEGRQGVMLERDRDMVARDEDGNYRLDMPLLGPLPSDEESEEKEAKTHLVETYRRHQQQTHPEGTGKKGDEERENCSLCTELQDTLRASLQAKLDSLEEDKWMFEAEDPKMMIME
ncbi:uncharacterized protein IWZ02DRAFT_273542 [Phyllosticta citriasiana]|uniref:Uncharacterized protein n=1 Tax=Phyllosticta citriasiana TaxID=595635 RepID=A0ABR1KZ87_9PEZI